MTKDEMKDAYTKHGVTMMKALVAGYEASLAATKYANEWIDAAKALDAEVADVAEEDFLTEDEQYVCFVLACHQAGIDPNHKALRNTRKSFKRLNESDARAMLSSVL